MRLGMLEDAVSIPELDESVSAHERALGWLYHVAITPQEEHDNLRPTCEWVPYDAVQPALEIPTSCFDEVIVEPASILLLCMGMLIGVAQIRHGDITW